jgi:hypothetical protein
MCGSVLQMFLHSFKSPYCRAVPFIKKSTQNVKYSFAICLYFTQVQKYGVKINQRLQFICVQERVVLGE